jgi:hypothetical protein
MRRVLPGQGADMAKYRYRYRPAEDDKLPRMRTPFEYAMWVLVIGLAVVLSVITIWR